MDAEPFKNGKLGASPWPLLVAYYCMWRIAELQAPIEPFNGLGTSNACESLAAGQYLSKSGMLIGCNIPSARAKAATRCPSNPPDTY